MATKVKCLDCGSASPNKHKVECKHFTCTECKALVNVTGHAKACTIGNDKAKSGTQAAREEAAARKTERAAVGIFFPVKIPIEALYELQRKINAGLFAGEKQSLTCCEYSEEQTKGVVGCSNVVPPGFSQKNVFHCPTCDRDKKTTTLKLCALHAITVWGGGHPHHAQTEMDLEK